VQHGVILAGCPSRWCQWVITHLSDRGSKTEIHQVNSSRTWQLHIGFNIHSLITSLLYNKIQISPNTVPTAKSTTLMAICQNNLGNPVPKCTILDFNGWWRGWQWAMTRAQLHSSGQVTPTILTPNFVAGRMPFLSTNEQSQNTEGRKHHIPWTCSSQPHLGSSILIMTTKGYLEGKSAKPLVSPLAPVPQQSI